MGLRLDGITVSGTVERRYKTERGFRAALKRLWPHVITVLDEMEREARQ